MSADRYPLVRAWDAPTRLFKWALVALVFGAWATHRWGDVTLTWHRVNGYAVLTLVLFRVLWGLFGSSTSRFGHWIKGPAAVARHALDMARGRREAWLGHTPLGGWMAIALLVFLAAQGFAGLFSVDSNGVFGGPFAHTDFMEPAPAYKDRLSWFHHHAYDWMLFLIGAHILVGLVHQFIIKDGLITAMVTGNKRLAPFRDEAVMVPAKAIWGKAALCLVVAAAVVLGGVTLAGGSLL